MPGYFEILRTPLLAGRTFTEADNAPGRHVVVIDRLLAAAAFPNESAVGKRIPTPFPDFPSVEVIGVVEHQRLYTLSDIGRPTIYYSEGLLGIGASRNWIIRTTGDPARYAAAIRAEVAKIDRKMVISKMLPMESLVDQDQA